MVLYWYCTGSSLVLSWFFHPTLTEILLCFLKRPPQGNVNELSCVSSLDLLTTNTRALWRSFTSPLQEGNTPSLVPSALDALSLHLLHLQPTLSLPSGFGAILTRP